MNKTKSILLSVVLLLGGALSASAQRFSIGSNIVDVLTFGTLEVEGSASVAKNVSVHVGGEFNPWTWRSGDQERQMQVRQASYWAGVRYWPWHVYSGWWAGIDGRYTAYNAGGVLKRQTEEGDAYGVGLYGGYAVMLNDKWTLDLGAGVWGGYKTYTVYACPLCGGIQETGEKTFLLPDVRVAIQYIF